WMGLGFAALGGAAFEAAGAVAGPFLIDQGLSEQAVGTFYLAAVAAMLLGALAGGPLSDRGGRRRIVELFVLLTAGGVFALALSVRAGAGPDLLQGLFVGLYLAIGLLTASSYALFMDITDTRLRATQFSAYMGATNLCESWSAFGIGRLHAWHGYAVAFTVMAALSLVGLIPLHWIEPRTKIEGPRAREG
ncbi:MAG: MFS transporter, partial [Deltaproteobacteria bacterium]|nr:MFS transporter [Deltaproteobacteria bacterium]